MTMFHITHLVALKANLSFLIQSCKRLSFLSGTESFDLNYKIYTANWRFVCESIPFQYLRIC